jgi:outer membrane protein assembly factor BamB
LIRRCDLGSGSIFATPVLTSCNLIVATLGGVLASVDAELGKVNWRSQRGKPFFSSPVLLNDEVFAIGDVSGQVKFVKVCDGSTKYSIQLDEGMFASMTKINLRIYAASKGKLYCIDWVDCVIEWFLDLKSQITCTPFVFTNNFLLLTSLSQIFIVDLTKKTVLLQHKFQGEIFSSPVVWNRNALVACRDNFLYSLQLSFCGMSN